MTDRIEAAMEGARDRIARRKMPMGRWNDETERELYRRAYDEVARDLSAINLRELLEAGESLAESQDGLVVVSDIQAEARRSWDIALAKLTGPGE